MQFFRWLIAVLGGYYWRPCPLCGKNYGGYEQLDTDVRLRTSRYEDVAVCLRCTDKARELNKKNKKEHMKEKPMIIDINTHLPIEENRKNG